MQFSFSDTHYNSVFGVSRTKNKKEPRKFCLTFICQRKLPGYLYDDSSIIRFSSLGP